MDTFTPVAGDQVDPVINLADFNKSGFFNKRVGRKAYWIVAFIAANLTGGLGKASTIFTNSTALTAYEIFVGCVFLFWVLISLWRINDIGRSKWYMILLFIPIVDFFVALDLMFTMGRLHKALTKRNAPSGMPQCPVCGRVFAQNKTQCPYCHVDLKVTQTSSL